MDFFVLNVRFATAREKTHGLLKWRVVRWYWSFVSAIAEWFWTKIFRGWRTMERIISAPVEWVDRRGDFYFFLWVVIPKLADLDAARRFVNFFVATLLLARPNTWSFYCARSEKWSLLVVNWLLNGGFIRRSIWAHVEIEFRSIVRGRNLEVGVKNWVPFDVGQFGTKLADQFTLQFNQLFGILLLTFLKQEVLELNFGVSPGHYTFSSSHLSWRSCGQGFRRVQRFFESLCPHEGLLGPLTLLSSLMDNLWRLLVTVGVSSLLLFFSDRHNGCLALKLVVFFLNLNVIYKIHKVDVLCFLKFV